MRLRTVVALSLVALFALPALSAAQHREPHAGSITLGADFGFYVPDEDFHTGIFPTVTTEIFVTPRISLRALYGWSRNEFVDLQQYYMEQHRLGFSAIWNWELEYWHPYVLAGFGGHAVRQYRDDGSTSGWENRAGYHVGGGVEYFVRKKITYKIEGTYYHVMDHPVGFEPSGFAITMGLKKYF